MALLRRFIRPKNSPAASAALFLLLIFFFRTNGWSQSTSASAGDPVADITTALRAHDYVQALRIGTVALKKRPKDVRLLALQGMAYSGVGKPDAALVCYQRALKVFPDYLPALEGAAQLEYQKGNGHAKPFLLRILKLRPNDPTTHAMLAVVYYKDKDCRGAVENFEQATPLFKNQPGALMEYGACLAELGRTSDAIPVLQQAVDLDSGNPVARYNLALAQWNANRTDDALTTLGPLLNSNSAPEEVLTLAADIYESNGNTQRAVDILRKAIVAHPKEKAAYLDFANLSFKHSSIQVGIDMLNIGIEQLPKEGQLYLARGVLLGQKSDVPSAMRDFATANRLDPNLSFVGAAEGIAESERYKPAAALATFRATAKQHPNDALTQYLLAEALTGEGKPTGSPDYLEAIAAAKRSVSLDPRMPDAHDLLASIYLQSDEMDKSIQQSKEALQVDPNDEQALYHLILAMRKVNKAEVPNLLKRLMKVRQEKQVEAKQSKHYRLIEAPASAEIHPSR